MAAIGHKTKHGVRYETSGAGFHTPNKYTKNDRMSRFDLEQELMEAEEELYDNAQNTENNDNIKN